MHWLSRASSGPSNRQRSTPVAFSENRAKLTPSPFQVAPRGYGWPGQMRIAGARWASHGPIWRWRERARLIDFYPTPSRSVMDEKQLAKLIKKNAARAEKLAKGR